MERLNQWLTLVANFGVVIGIVFLAYEMRLNTNAMLSGTAAQMVSNWNSIQMTIAAEDGLPEALAASLEKGWKPDFGSGQSSAQTMRVLMTGSSMLRSTEYEFNEYQRGNLDEETWAAHRWANRDFIASSQYLMITWRLGRNGFGSSFRDFMDDLIRDICSQQECPEGGRPEDWIELST